MIVLNDAIFYNAYEISTLVTRFVERNQQIPFFEQDHSTNFPRWRKCRHTERKITILLYWLLYCQEHYAIIIKNLPDLHYTHKRCRGSITFTHLVFCALAYILTLESCTYVHILKSNFGLQYHTPTHKYKLGATCK